MPGNQFGRKERDVSGDGQAVRERNGGCRATREQDEEEKRHSRDTDEYAEEGDDGGEEKVRGLGESLPLIAS